MGQHLSESVQLHDKYQFELKFNYPLDRRSESAEYHVDTFMFIPNNLCVNASTYSRDDFFNDMQKYIRFKTPALLLRVIDQGDDSPLARLASSMKALAESRDHDASGEYEESLKMFCSILKSALRDEEAFLERSKGDTNFEELVTKYLKSVKVLLAKFRGLKISVQAPSVDPRLLKLFELADEFVSMTAGKYLSRLVMLLKTVGMESLRKDAVTAIEAECVHRAVCQQPSTPKESSDNEEYLYRESVLKKIMASILFLRTSVKREGVLLEQMLFGLAAGLAMAFATFVAFYSRTVVAIQDFSLSFFAILVVAYMFKDRIKEMSRVYLSSKLRAWLCDYRTDIFNALDRKVGVCRESFSFIPESKASREIIKLRNKDYVSELENGCVGEDIIMARKSIRLFTKGCERIFSGFDVDGVVDIMRFNVRGFLEKMDNPNKEIPLVSDGDVVMVKGRRVYHVNLIIRYGMEGREDSYRRFRLILARNGIKRIEELPAFA